MDIGVSERISGTIGGGGGGISSVKSLNRPGLRIFRFGRPVERVGGVEGAL